MSLYNGSTGIVDASGNNAVLTPSGAVTTAAKSATGTTTSVAASATNVTLLAANTNRLGATIFNEGTANLFVKCGVTASTTSYTVQVGANAYFEVPFNYTGQIDAIWSIATGNARITEFS